MIDLKAVQLMNAARVTKVDLMSAEQAAALFLPAPGTRPPIVLDLLGENFDRAQEVLINSVSASFRLLSASRMAVTLPESLLRAQIKSVFVLTDSATFTSTSLYKFALGSSSEFFAGYQKLISQYLKLLMTTPGSGVFARTAGGGLQKFPGTNQKAPHQTLTTIAQRLLNVGEQLKKSQEGTELPPEEKLRTVEIVNIAFDKGDPTSIVAGVRVRTFAGTGLPINLQFGSKSLVDRLLAEGT